ncbi:fimbrial protein [Pseudomonas sp. BN414]|uniref:fimbrial protein n=1 Tax=Pseudomonas sp. BN414 TaxID=2567888 RepID=UPI002455E5FF|nr:fimbrial protein [Pseudomonas sp. BN414]
MLQSLLTTEFAMAFPCVTIAGPPHQNHFDFTQRFNSPNDNAPNMVMPNANIWELPLYLATCHCPKGQIFRENYYTARTDLVPGNKAVVNGQQLQFYKLNRNLQVAFELWVDGDLREYVPVPFSSVSNLEDYAKTCQVGKDYGTGTKGRIHLMIDRPFVGESTISNTQLLEVFGDTHPNAAATTPIAGVTMTGRVSVPQSCKLASGQVTTIDFDNVEPRSLAVPGAASPANSRERTFQITCTNISQGVAINLSLESAANAHFPNVFATHGRTDLGIQVNNNGRMISPLLPDAAPDFANIIPLTLNYTQQSAEFSIEAFPVRTERNVEPGPFEGTATLKFDFN